MRKQIITTVAVLALGTTLAMAAPNEGNGGEFMHHRHGHHAFGKKLAAKLNLTDAQKQQMRDINKGFRSENKAFFESFHQNMKDARAAKKAGDTAKLDALKPTLQSQRAQMKSLDQARREKFESILTPDQRAQLNQWKAERAARRQQQSDSK